MASTWWPSTRRQKIQAYRQDLLQRLDDQQDSDNNDSTITTGTTGTPNADLGQQPTRRLPALADHLHGRVDPDTLDEWCSTVSSEIKELTSVLESTSLRLAPGAQSLVEKVVGIGLAVPIAFEQVSS